MVGMLSVGCRNLSRPIIRNTRKCLGNNLIKTQHTERAYHQIAPVAIGSIRASNLAINRHRSVFELWHQSKNFRTSASLFDEVKVVNAPEFPDSVAEGDLRWQKKVGDHVAEDESVAEIETDKTAMPVPAPAHGVVEELLVPDGTTIKSKTPLFKFRVTGVKPTAAAAPAKAAAAAPPPPAAPKPAAAAPPPPKAPSAAAAPPPAAAPPKPAPPRQAIPVAAVRHAQSLEAATVRLPPQDPTKEISGTRSEHRVKMNRMRLKIAERLKSAQNTNAMLTTFNEIDMSAIMQFRKQHMEAFLKKYGVKLGFMSAFAKASAYALQDQPVVNAVIDDSTKEIVYRDYVDISVAVATPKGLVVPVLRNVERMNFSDIELGLNALGEKARKGALAVEDMDGGTFTISNGGVFGSLMGTPIINPPQSSILGMHATFERPVAINGQVVIKPMMYVALTYDHRLIDGREAVLFLRKIKAGIEDPRIILAGL